MGRGVGNSRRKMTKSSIVKNKKKRKNTNENFFVRQYFLMHVGIYTFLRSRTGTGEAELTQILLL